MPNTSKNFNPAYSTVKAIYLSNNANALDITKQNAQCRFERLETVENINEVFPNGSVGVTDLKDMASFIGYNNITRIVIEFFDGSSWDCDITSASYSTNAASNSENNLFVIHFTNHYYRYFSTNTLTQLMSGWGYNRPTVFSINELVTLLRTKIFGSQLGYQDYTDNYFLYKPLIPYNNREETLPDNAVEFLNYISTGAVGASGGGPNFLFWTGLDGSVNFKYFQRDIASDPSYGSIGANYRNIAVFDGESVVQKLSGGKYYRKAYFLATNPAFQWISKNYYYVRKTPKYLDVIPSSLGVSGATASSYTTANLAFHFQDDGQKYNIDIVTMDGRGYTAPFGGDRLIPENTWGYFDGGSPTNNKSVTNLLSNNYGTNEAYQKLNFMGVTGYMPFLDSPDMWKNMFDMTPIHPDYPNSLTSPPKAGSATVLDTVMKIRDYVAKDLNYYDGPLKLDGSTTGDRLSKLREIEAQNFVMYSLCCMGRGDDCFFAVLQKYEIDNTIPLASTAPYLSKAKKYRYKWNKLIFSNPSGASGASGAAGGSFGNTYPNKVESWYLDPSVKSNPTQDDTWAINLNERGLTAGYLPPGWAASSSTNLVYRPIGMPATQTTLTTSGDILHIARVCIEPVGGNDKVIYFWAENIVDGNC